MTVHEKEKILVDREIVGLKPEQTCKKVKVKAIPVTGREGR
jgi:hypothetical protein